MFHTCSNAQKLAKIGIDLYTLFFEYMLRFKFQIMH